MLNIPGGGDPTRGADFQLAEERPCPAELGANGHHPDGPRHLPRDHQPGYHRPEVHRLWHLHLCGCAEGWRHPRDQHRRQHLFHNWWASHPFVSATHLHASLDTFSTHIAHREWKTMFHFRLTQMIEKILEGNWYRQSEGKRIMAVFFEL